AFDLEIVDPAKATPGPDKPGVPRQVGELIMMPNKDGIMEPQGIAPTGTPGVVFEYKGKTYKRDANGKDFKEFDPEGERVPVEGAPGVPPGTTLPQRKLDELRLKQIEADQAAAREREKTQAQWAEDQRKADLAARREETKARRASDRSELADRDKQLIPFTQVRGSLDQIDSLIAQG